MKRLSVEILLMCFWLPALIAGTATPTAAASTHLVTRAQVLPWTSLETVRHVDAYTVAEADLARGYVDLPAAVTISIATNSSRTVMLTTVSTSAEKVSFIEAEKLGASLRLNTPTGGSYHYLQTTLGYRIELPPGTPPGRYALHASLNIETL